MAEIISFTFRRLRVMTVAALSALSLIGSETSLMVVHPEGPGAWVLEWRGKRYHCAVGRNGVAKEGDKREGDGKTPCGTFPLRSLYFRADKVDRGRLPVSLKPRALTRNDGWCDAPGDPNYNRFVPLPYSARHEDLWRDKDDLYDLIIPLGYNDDPAIPGLGSAIFMHVARSNYAPTAGCVALSKRDLMEVLPTVEAGCRMCITAESPYQGRIDPPTSTIIP